MPMHAMRQGIAVLIASVFAAPAIQAQQPTEPDIHAVPAGASADQRTGDGNACGDA